MSHASIIDGCRLSRADVLPYAPAMVFPIVARGKARLRLQVSASHTNVDLDHAAAMLAKVVSGKARH